MKRQIILITLSLILLSLTTSYIYSNDKVYLVIKCNNIEKDMYEKVRAIFISEFKRHNYDISESLKDCVYIFIAEVNIEDDYLKITLMKLDKDGNLKFLEKKIIKDLKKLKPNISILVKSVISEKPLLVPKKKSKVDIPKNDNKSDYNSNGNDKVYFEIKCNNIVKDLCEEVRLNFISEFKKKNYDISESKKDCEYIFIADVSLNKDYLVIELQKQDKDGKILFSEKKLVDNYNELELYISVLVKSVILEMYLSVPKNESKNKSKIDFPRNYENKYKKDLFKGDFFAAGGLFLLSTFADVDIESNEGWGFRFIYEYEYLHTDLMFHFSGLLFPSYLIGARVHFQIPTDFITPYFGTGFVLGRIYIYSNEKRLREIEEEEQHNWIDTPDYRNTGFFIPVNFGLELFSSYLIQIIFEVGVYLPLQEWEKEKQAAKGTLNTPFS